MTKSSKILIPIQLLVLTVTPLFSQINSPLLGVATGPIIQFKIQRSIPLDETISNFYVAPSFRINRTEFFAGIIVPIVFQRYDGGDEKFYPHIGALTSCRIYILNPRKQANLIFQYEFQYISYSTTHPSISSSTGKTNLIRKTYKNYNSLFGVGFIGFFNKSQNFGFSIVISYMFPIQYYQSSTELHYYDKVKMWGHSDHIENYFNYCFSLNIKLVAFRKNNDKNEK